MGSVAFLAVLVLPGHSQAPITQGLAMLVPMALAAALAAGAAYVIHRWTDSTRWTRRHTLALTAGALVGHSVVWGATQPTDTITRIAVAAMLAATIFFLWMLSRGTTTHQ